MTTQLPKCIQHFVSHPWNKTRIQMYTSYSKQVSREIRVSFISHSLSARMTSRNSDLVMPESPKPFTKEKIFQINACGLLGFHGWLERTAGIWQGEPKPVCRCSSHRGSLTSPVSSLVTTLALRLLHAFPFFPDSKPDLVTCSCCQSWLSLGLKCSSPSSVVNWGPLRWSSPTPEGQMNFWACATRRRALVFQYLST